MDTVTLGLLCGASALAVAFLSTTIVITQQKRVKLIETLGKYSHSCKPGLSFKWPAPISIVAMNVNMQILELSENVGVKSDDNAFLTIPVSVQYQVLDAQISHYKLNNSQSQLKKFINNRILGIASGMSMDDLFKARKTFETEIIDGLNDKFGSFGFQILNVLIGDPQPSEALKASFDQKLVAEREKDAAGAKAEALKIKMVGEAEAEKASLELKGQALAKFRDTIAKGNADAMNEMLGDVEGLTAPMILEFFKTIDTNEANRDMAGKGNTVIITSGSGESTSDIAMMQGLINAASSKSPPSRKAAPKDKSSSK